ncbi:hypothetical protein [Amycolatopsis sp. cmx-4-54]|uniref:hypothetical protein n=1 Tax=Amycolatopsis sp. cmx-4-54 TaxID=2790936 RepID=UPI00397E2CCF
MSPLGAVPALPWIGTLVTAVIDGHTITGKVMPYQYSRLSQTTFPVAFGARRRTMTAATVTELPHQPPGRREPDRIGECAPTAATRFRPLVLIAADPDTCEPVIPAQRSTTVDTQPVMPSRPRSATTSSST